MSKVPLDELKILIVEDQADARSMIKTMLNNLGINQVFEAMDGREALNFIDAAPDFVNCIICDWNMPNMTGLDFLKQIRTVDQNVPFLMVTGRNDMDSVMSAKGAGVSAYIRKPFSPLELEGKLRIIAQKMAA